MAGLILTDDCVPVIETLSSQLKRNTVAFVAQIDKCPRMPYSPRLCMRPALDTAIRTTEILASCPARGTLVIDKAYLTALDTFSRGQGLRLRQGLPGNPSDWDICKNPLEERSDLLTAAVDAIQIVKTSAPFFASMYDLLVEMLIALKACDRSRGFSCHFARGAIFRAFPTDSSAEVVAIDIVHEIGHQALMVYQSVDPILLGDHDAPVYSYIRRADRPAIQSLHAAVALAFMTRFRDTLTPAQGAIIDSDPRIKGYGETLRAGLRNAIRALDEKCSFTTLGGAIMDELQALAK